MNSVDFTPIIRVIAGLLVAVAALLGVLVAVVHAQEPMTITEAPNSVEVQQGDERLWCVTLPGVGLPMHCWPVVNVAPMLCRLYPSQGAVTCVYPDGSVVTRQHGKMPKVRRGS